MEAQAQAICMAPTTSAAPLKPFSEKRQPGVQGRLMPDRSFLDWPVPRREPSALAASWKTGAGRAAGTRMRRMSIAPAAPGREARRGRLASLLRPGAFGGVHDELDVRSLR
jgi:hypothetical protein